ncbi:MAG: CRTAC1 family protein [Candidatus Neomarinimicrobiota bacterium]
MSFFNNLVFSNQLKDKIYLEDKTNFSEIDFIHYAPRPRWCEIGPSVVGAATNEGLNLVFEEEQEYWKSNNRLLTMDEFANVHLIKMNGSGGAWLDYDLDGDWDLYLVNCQGEETEITNALYENLGNGKFIKKSKTGAEDIGEGMSVSVSDYDNDGDSDLFVTNYGDFKLFRNNGDKTFSDVSIMAFPDGIKDWWYGGSTWGDYDLDGDLDLYVAGYVDFSRRPQYTSLRFPMDFGGLPNTIYRNNGDGTFKDVTTDLNILTDASRKSMQVLFHDFNDDGFPDLFVANDTDANGFYLNRGDGTFKIFSGPSGLSTTDGSMGLAIGDINNDGMTDIVYTNYAAEVNTLAYLIDNNSSNDGILKNAVFTHSFDSPIVHKLSWPNISWGPGLFDMDNDGDLDLFFANGHLNSVSGDNRQSNLLFENNGHGFFKDISNSSGILATGKRIHRSAIFADYNNDGKIDMYVTVNGQQIEDGKGNTIFDANQGKGILLQNKSETQNNWLKIRLEGVKSNRDAYGALVNIQTKIINHSQSLVSGQGYFSNNAKELYFGLGEENIIDIIEVKWPSRLKQTFKNISSNQTIYILEGKNYITQKN